ncbi:hypothetical protein HYR54_01410 [Candidatus Acetothermia bacterium]|nr:hypothetical protein [Candidatus Acetothermia bacterium]MBI3461159.1 hypothetical protein [Candidatus Acetothermia bacterium]
MKKSKHIGLGLLTVAALSLSGCSSQQAQQCIDKSNMVVEDQKCEQIERQPGWNPGVWNTSPYRWYYGGTSNGAGSFVSGGSYAPTPGKSYSKGLSHSVRGGFGSTGHGHSGS